MKRILQVLILFIIPLNTFAVLNPIIDSIPMRDGRKLAADIYIPTTCTGTCPTILIQTPYNRIVYRFVGLPLQIGMNVNASNYIIVIVDWRGFYGSAAAAYSGSPTRGEDGYDVVEWVAAQTWSNTKVGTWGPSALGGVQFNTAEYNPPSLVCMVPQVAGPQFEYTEYYPGGVYRTEYIEQLDALGYGLSTLLLANPLHNNLWSFAEFNTFYPDSIRVPTFMIGGWYDHNIKIMLEFFNGIRTQSPVNVRDKHRLLMGPWAHGGSGTAQVGSPNQGQLMYTNAAWWSDSLAMDFFDYHMRNIPNNWNLTPYIEYYQMGENTWQTSAVWPPTGLTNYNLYFHPNGSMDAITPTVSTGSSSFNYDPNDPSPTIGGSTLRQDLEQGPWRQDTAVENRNDVLVFSTIPLGQNVVMKGIAQVKLKVSSNRKDTDFNIRLTDVYPDGRSMLLQDGTYRMRFRNGFTAGDTAAMVPNQIYDCTIDLPATCNTFLAGHRIRVDVTSSNYPRFNRNMNTDGPMYPGPSGDTLVNAVIATNTVYMNSTNNSYIRLPLVDFIGGLSSISENNINMDLYPNPASNEVTVFLSEEMNATISVLDVHGKLVFENKMKGKQLVLSLQNFDNGIYFVRIASEKGIAVKKLVVTK